MPTTPAPDQSAHIILPLTFRFLARADIPAVLEIEQTTSARRPWSESAFSNVLRSSGSFGIVAEYPLPQMEALTPPVQVVGFLIYSRLQRNTIHILNLATHCDYRFYGVASALLAHLTTQPDNLARRVTIAVPEHNLAVQKFLRASNFRATGFLPDSTEFPCGDSRYVFELERKLTAAPVELSPATECSGSGTGRKGKA